MSKKIISTALILILFLLNANVVNASTLDFNASANKEELKPGDEVIITMSIDNINVEKGINVIEAWLKYDDKIFENVEMQNVNGWEITYNTESGDRYGKFLISKMVEGQTEKEDVGKIKLKVKNNIPKQETEIKISEITSNDGTQLIDEGERIIKFKINNTDDDENQNNTNTDKNETNTNTNTNETNTNTNENNTNTDKEDTNTNTEKNETNTNTDGNNTNIDKNNTNTGKDKNTSNKNNSNSLKTNSSKKDKTNKGKINTGDITVIVSVVTIAIAGIVIFIIKKNKDKDKNKEKDENDKTK